MRLRWINPRPMATPIRLPTMCEEAEAIQTMPIKVSKSPGLSVAARMFYVATTRATHKLVASASTEHGLGKKLAPKV